MRIGISLWLTLWCSAWAAFLTVGAILGHDGDAPTSVLKPNLRGSIGRGSSSTRSRQLQTVIALARPQEEAGEGVEDSADGMGGAPRRNRDTSWKRRLDVALKPETGDQQDNAQVLFSLDDGVTGVGSPDDSDAYLPFRLSWPEAYPLIADLHGSSTAVGIDDLKGDVPVSPPSGDEAEGVGSPDNALRQPGADPRVADVHGRRLEVEDRTVATGRGGKTAAYSKRVRSIEDADTAADRRTPSWALRPDGLWPVDEGSSELVSSMRDRTEGVGGTDGLYAHLPLALRWPHVDPLLADLHGGVGSGGHEDGNYRS